MSDVQHMTGISASVAPTGTISIIAGTSSGIEPLFAISFVRHVLEGARLLEVSPLFEQAAKERGIYSHELMTELAKKGSVQEIAGVPQDMKDLFVTALDIPPEQHVKIQAAFQKHTDNAVSKTVKPAPECHCRRRIEGLQPRLRPWRTKASDQTNNNSSIFSNWPVPQFSGPISHQRKTLRHSHQGYLLEQEKEHSVRQSPIDKLNISPE